MSPDPKGLGWMQRTVLYHLADRTGLSPTEFRSCTVRTILTVVDRNPSAANTKRVQDVLISLQARGLIGAQDVRTAAGVERHYYSIEALEQHLAKVMAA